MVSQLEHNEETVPTDLGTFVNGLILPIEAVHRTYPSGENAGRDFVTQVAAAILDTYFKDTGAYDHRHVQQPIGLLGNKGYAFQAAKGSGGFSWEYQYLGLGHKVMVTLEEWIQFKNAFDRTGIGVGKNTFDPDWATTSRNIVFDDSRYDGGERLPPSWVRVVDESVPVDWKQLGRFIKEHEQDLSDRLGPLAGVLKSAQQAGMGQLDPRHVMDKYHAALR